MRILRWAGRFWTGVLAVSVALAGLLIGLRLLLPIFDAPPQLLAATPADGAAGVAVRAPITLQFAGPMNPRSVEAALQISPTVRWLPQWDPARTTLTISPTEPLAPDTAYLLALGQGALSRRFRALQQPLALRFRTAQAPAVVAVLPADASADVPLDSPISISFSRAIVLPTELQRPQPIPDLRFDPPIAGQATWLDQSTVLFRPSAPLTPGTRYRATLDAALTDLGGGQLRSPYSWSFQTPAPHVLALAPADGDRLVPPRATLALTISQPLALESLRASLAFSPTIAGELRADPLPGGRQLVTLTPAEVLRAGTTYTATLLAGVAPIEGNLPLLATLRWSFTTAPQPGLSARFPGEGQILPRDQEIRLVFNTPIDPEALRARLQIDPPAPDLQIDADDTEVHIRASLSAATVYTLTLPADLADRNGVVLGQEYRARFLTAPAGPQLALPEAPAGRAQVPPGQPASLLLRRTNLSALDFDLFQLDEATLLRTAGFHPADWPGFQPERYGQPLLRSWRVSLADPLNTPAEDRVPLTNESGAPLPAGAYYLRIRSGEGPRADLVLLVSRTRLALQASLADAPAAGLLVWATDVISGTPLAGLPVTLYQGGALVRQATTDDAGVAVFAGLGRAGLPGAVALAGGPQPGAANAEWLAGAPPAQRARLFLATDRAAYYPGESLRLAGFARAAEPITGTLGLPALSLTLRSQASGERIYQATLRPGPTGVFSATVPLGPGAPPGQYLLSLAAGAQTTQARFTIEPRPAAPLRIAIDTPAPLAGGDDVPIELSVRTAEGLPVAGATISWTLTAERAGVGASDGFVFGDDERSPPIATQRAGVLQTDVNGRFSMVVSDLDLDDQPLRYRLVAQASEPGGAGGVGLREFGVAPAQRIAGLRLASQIVRAGAAETVELLAIDARGQPAPGTSMRVEVYRRTWERVADAPAAWVARDRLAFTRSASAGPDGRASVALRLPSAGAYRLRASTAESASNASYSAASAWASAPGFAGWGELPGGGPLLIADQPAYRPGDTATLLLVANASPAGALLTRGGAGGIVAEARTIRAGEPFTLTVGAADTPALPVSLTLTSRLTSAPSAVAVLPELTTAHTLLPVLDGRRELVVTIDAGVGAYAPGATATLTITTSDAAGNRLPADVLLSLADRPVAPALPIGVVFGARAPALLGPVRLPPTFENPPSSDVALPQAQPVAQPAYWDAELRTDATGVLTVTLALPREPAALLAQAWAAGSDRFGAAERTLAISEALELQLVRPPEFRAGDEVELAALLRNAGDAPAELSVELLSQGIELLNGAPATQSALVPPGTVARLTWPARVLPGARVHVQVAARAGAALEQTEPFEQAVLPAAEPPPANHGLALLREYLDLQTGQALDLASLRAGQLVRVRLTLVSPTAQRGLVIDEALPAGAALAQALPGGFDQLARAPGRLTLTRAQLAPGILQYEYLLRLAASGRYRVPAALARAQGGAQGAGNGQDLIVGQP